MGWAVTIVSAIALAALVAWWNAKAALFGAALAALGLMAGFGYWINHWEECDPCPRAADVVGTINAFLFVLAPALAVCGVARLATRSAPRDKSSA